MLTVSDMVEPRPGYDCRSGLQSLRNFEVEEGKLVRWIGRRQVSISLDGVVSFPRLHNAPDTVLSWRRVVSDEHLSRTTTVHSSPFELQRLGGAWFIGLSRGLRRAVLAREVGAIGS